MLELKLQRGVLYLQTPLITVWTDLFKTRTKLKYISVVPTINIPESVLGSAIPCTAYKLTNTKHNTSGVVYLFVCFSLLCRTIQSFNYICIRTYSIICLLSQKMCAYCAQRMQWIECCGRRVTVVCFFFLYSYCGSWWACFHSTII